MTEEFSMDSKAECDQLSLAHVTKNIEETKTNKESWFIWGTSGNSLDTGRYKTCLIELSFVNVSEDVLALRWSYKAWRLTLAACWNRYSCSNLAVPCGSLSADTLIRGSVKYLQHHSKNSVDNTELGDDSSSRSSICRPTHITDSAVHELRHK